MRRIGIKLVPVGYLDEAAEIHHRHAIGDMTHHRQVVSDEQKAQAEPRLQVLEQIDDLPLDRNVERGNGLVADDEARLERERARNADALALPARKLVRIALRHVGEEADLAEQRLDALALLLAIGGQAVDAKRLADDLSDRHAWIERRIRVLEDRLDPCAAFRAFGPPSGG